MSFFRTVLVNLGPGPVRAITGGFSYSDALAVVFLVLFALGLRHLYAAGQRHLVLFSGLLFALPLSISYLTLGVSASWDWARYISHLLLPFLIVCSVGWQAATSLLKTPFQRGLALTLLALAILPNTLRLPDREEYRHYRETAAYLDAHRNDLRGVIVLPARNDIGRADERITNIYYHHKREHLPVYQVTDGTIRRVRPTPSAGHLAEIARGSDVPESSLPPGRYALLWRRPVKDCGAMTGWVTGMKVTASSSAGILPGLTVCNLDFAP